MVENFSPTPSFFDLTALIGDRGNHSHQTEERHIQRKDTSPRSLQATFEIDKYRRGEDDDNRQDFHWLRKALKDAKVI
jgi:hypothetical protein